MGASSSKGSAAHPFAYTSARERMSPMPLSKGTAYLSIRFQHEKGAEGTSLDLFLDSSPGSPLALPAAAVASATVQISGSGVTRTLALAPAPANERPPNESPDVCSHFSCLAPLVTRESIVIVTIEIAGESIAWKNFIPSLFAWRDE